MQRMNTLDTALGPIHVQSTIPEINLAPSQGAEFTSPEAMPVGQEDRRCIPSAISSTVTCCFDQPINASTNAAGTLPRTYIASVKEEYPARVVFEPFAARARREGWTYHELPTGHDCQAEMPDELSELLLGA